MLEQLNSKLTEQNNNFVFNFENYILRQQEEEEKANQANSDEEYDEEAGSAESEAANEYGSDASEEVVKQPTTAGGKKKKIKNGAFAINTSYCRSELELLQHVIYKNQFQET